MSFNTLENSPSLRRSRRTSIGPSSYREQDLRKSSPSIMSPRKAAARRPTTGPISTPQKQKKRVRFSEPPVSHSSRATGLTPAVRRASLGATPLKRRPQTPSRATGNGMTSSPLAFSPSSRLNSPDSGEVSFLPLRQVLDGRVRRRLRRNGLSEEMNRIREDRKKKRRVVEQEMDRLRKEVKERDLEIYRLQNTTIEMDTDRIWELEHQIEDLKSQLNTQEDHHRRSLIPSSPSIGGESQCEWTLATKDPFNADTYSEADTDEGMGTFMDAHDHFGDVTMAEVATGTPAPKTIIITPSSFPTPPSTSPHLERPNTPCLGRFSHHLPTLTSHMGIQTTLQTKVSNSGVQVDLRLSEAEAGTQADMPDPGRQLLEEELASMRREVSKLTSAIESYNSLISRLGDKLDQALSSSDDLSLDLEARLTQALQSLSDKTAALIELSSSLSNLGFPSGDAFDVVNSISDAFRGARLELEYLTPGEITLPLNSVGAKTLDLLLARLRELAKRVKESDDSLDEYRQLERSLRNQLSARVEAMEKDAREKEELVARVTSRDEEIKTLEVAVSRLRGAVEGYERDMRELETLVETMEKDQEVSQQLLAEAKEDSEVKEITNKALQEQLAKVEAEARKLHDERDALDRARTNAATDMTRAHSAILAERDHQIAKLRDEVDFLNAKIAEGLENTQLTIRSLRQQNEEMAAKAGMERRRAKKVVSGMRRELSRVIRMSNDFFAAGEDDGEDSSDTLSVASQDDEETQVAAELPHKIMDTVPVHTKLPPTGFFVGNFARKAGRRKYDSGVGVMEDDDDEFTQVQAPA